VTARSPEEIAALLARVGLGDGPVRLTPLHGGYMNEVLLIETASRRFVLKFVADATEGTLFPNLPEAEAEAARRLAGLDVAPGLIGYWPEDRAIACDYVEGGTWSGDVAAVAALLLRKEAADPAGFRAVPLTPRAILAEGETLFAQARGVTPPPCPAPTDLPPPARLSLIHTDIGPANLIGAGAGLRLIDWQCPAAGDACEDIYSFLSPAFQILSGRAPLSPGDRAAFFAALNRPNLQARHRLIEPFYAWRMAGYCAMRAVTHPDAEIRARYRRALDVETTLLPG
jgi:Ser/Thr protein kinase RdoA (MazF antagonist)